MKITALKNNLKFLFPSQEVDLGYVKKHKRNYSIHKPTRLRFMLGNRVIEYFTVSYTRPVKNILGEPVFNFSIYETEDSVVVKANTKSSMKSLVFKKDAKILIASNKVSSNIVIVDVMLDECPFYLDKEGQRYTGIDKSQVHKEYLDYWGVEFG